ncbi:CARDB domain-containing protein, partial [Falsiroseomonas sp.]|uniref:CARDB domain-containing protein n=1 Tax=Falsiroseomonas sp. TaxID=2870721 RepID=UPI00356820E6
MSVQGYIQAPFSSSLGKVAITQASWLDSANVDTHASGIDSASIDFGLPVGTDVLSMAAGIVIGIYSSADENDFDPDTGAASGNDMGPRGFGNVVTVFHYIDRVDSGLPYYFVATYAHLDASSVSSIADDFASLEEGEQLFVEAGTKLGEVGTSGYSYGSVGHLHVNFGVTSTTDNLLASGFPLDEDSPYPNANENLLNFLGFDGDYYVDGVGSLPAVSLAELKGDIPVFSYITSNNDNTGEPPAVGSGSSYGGSGIDGPDLVGADLDISGSVFDVGEDFDFILDISNVGDLTSSDYSVAFYITEEKNIDDAVYLFREEDLFSLSPGEIDRYDYYAYTNGTWYTGYYYLAAVIDADNNVDEIDERNNIIYERFYLQGAAPPSDQPDLTANFIGFNTSAPRIGDSVTISWSVTNRNGRTADAPFATGIYISQDQTVTTSDRLLLNATASEGLAAGQEQMFSKDFVFDSSFLPGEYWIAAIADVNNSISESNETNNALVYGFKFTIASAPPALPDPDLTVVDLDVALRSDGSGLFDATFTVKNNGGSLPFGAAVILRLSATQDISWESSYALGSGDVFTGPMNSVDSISLSISNIDLDWVRNYINFVPGTYYFAAEVDYSGYVDESNELNNVSNLVPVELERLGVVLGDITEPFLSSTSPADNATGVAVGTNLALTFNEAVKAGSGTVEIYNSSGALWRSVAVTDTTQVSFSGSTMTINPAADLAAGTGYYVRMASGVVRDTAGNAFAGITSNSAFNFNTAAAPDTAPPTLSSFGPMQLRHAGFGYAPEAGGWSSDDRYPRQLADVNADGRADIVGFGNAGVWVALADASGNFGPMQLRHAGFGYAPEAGGWSSDDRYPRQLADVNADGRADIVGFGNAGVWVALADASGNFGPMQLRHPGFGYAPEAGGWSSDDSYPRQLADVNA